MQFGMRLLLVCMTLCVLRPADLRASSELWFSATSFAYFGHHGTSVLPATTIEALRPEADSPSAAHAPWLDAGYKSPREFSRNELCLAAVSVAEANNLPAPFFANLIQQESGFRPYVVSRAGAQGIAQFMPRVATAYGLTNPFDPIHALIVSGRFLRELVTQFGNLGLAAAAYNAGPKRVDDWLAKRGKLPSETRHYVRNITGMPAERWTGRKAISQELKLPAYARCPGMPVAVVRLPGSLLPPVKIAAAPPRSGPKNKPTELVSAQRKPRGKVQIIAKTDAASKPAAKREARKHNVPLKISPVLAQAKLAKRDRPASRPSATRRIKVVAAR